MTGGETTKNVEIKKFKHATFTLPTLEQSSTVNYIAGSTPLWYYTVKMGRRLEYRQFVSIREHKIQEHHAEPEVASRANNRHPRECRRSPVMEPRTDVSIPMATGVTPRTSPETKAGTKEAQCSRRRPAVIRRRDNFDQLLEANILHNVLRIWAWIQRFIRNFQISNTSQKTRPLDSRQRWKATWTADQTS